MELEMNEQFEKLMYKSGLTAQGCWDEMDSYMHDAIKQFAELIVEECAEVGSKFSQAHPLDIQYQIKRHFGVEE
jgi:hypothetical protein